MAKSGSFDFSFCKPRLYGTRASLDSNFFISEINRSKYSSYILDTQGVSVGISIQNDSLKIRNSCIRLRFYLSLRRSLWATHVQSATLCWLPNPRGRLREMQGLQSNLLFLQHIALILEIIRICPRKVGNLFLLLHSIFMLIIRWPIFHHRRNRLTFGWRCDVFQTCERYTGVSSVGEISDFWIVI
jgi:hypothetical protein